LLYYYYYSIIVIKYYMMTYMLRVRSVALFVTVAPFVTVPSTVLPSVIIINNYYYLFIIITFTTMPDSV
jgi:hypothetical protein